MIHFKVPFFPPSTNHAYFTRGHLRVLTKVGKKFKNEVKNFIGRDHPEIFSYFRQDVEYEVLLLMHFQEGSLYNKTWMKEPGVRRHKTVDATNRVKLAEDAVVEAIGYNDSQNFCVSVVKVEALVGQEPYFEFWAWNEESNGPIAEFIKHRAL